MSATATDIDTGVDLFLDHLFNEEKPCEHGDHATMDRTHEGPAKWYLRGDRKPCGHTAPDLYVCDRWAKLIMAGKLGLMCGVCESRLPREYIERLRFIPLDSL